MSILEIHNSVVSDELLLEQALLASFVSHMDTDRPSSSDMEGKAEKIPPASKQTLKTLPHLQLRKEDLVDPVNQECCVCLESHQEDSMAVRLSKCGHIFCKECVTEWLERKSTCPFCRLEYPTDNSSFETKRLEREKEAKPRYTRAELEQMPLDDLQALVPDSHSSDNQEPRTKSQLMQEILESGKVHLINVPKPCAEYSLKALRSMTVHQLRKVMNKDAGVFCERSVTRKEDMIQVFLQSGRLRVLDDDAASASLLNKRDSLKERRSPRLRNKIQRLFSPRVGVKE